MRYCNRIKSVRAAGDFRLKLVFDDGFISELDFAPLVAREGGPLLDPLKDAATFQQVKLDHGVLSWSHGYDICSDVVRFWCERGRVLSRAETDAAFLEDFARREQNEPATLRETHE